jgi:AraC family transcriptional regulator, positive regulator of tynA and feaB
MKRNRRRMGEHTLGRSTSGIRVGSILTGGTSPASEADKWMKFIGDWLIPGDVEFGRRDSSSKCSAQVVSRQHGPTLAFGELRQQRILHTRQHVGGGGNGKFALYVVTDGAGEIQQGGECVRFNAGDVVLRDGGGPSLLTFHGSIRWGVMLLAADQLGPVIRQRFGGSPVVFPTDAIGRVALLDLFQTAAASPQHALAKSFRHFEEAVTAVLRYSGVAAAYSPVREENITSVLLDIIDRNLRNANFTLVDLANTVGKSERWVRHLLHMSGVQFKRYVIHQRLELARQALLDPAYRNDPILSIALDCGFSDQSQFGRCFAGRFGMPPGRFRREAAQSDAVVDGSHQNGTGHFPSASD